MVAFALLGSTMRAAVDDSDALSTAGTIFAGVFVQALPFLALGVLLSALIAVFVTPDRLARWLPKRPAAAVLVADAGEWVEVDEIDSSANYGTSATNVPTSAPAPALEFPTILVVIAGLCLLALLWWWVQRMS